MPALPQPPHHPAYGSASGGVFAKDNFLNCCFPEFVHLCYITIGNHKGLNPTIRNIITAVEQMRVPVIAAIKQADDSKRGSPVACDIGGQTPNTWVNYAVPYALGAVPVIVENNSCVEEQYGAIELEKRHRACMKK